MSELPRYVYDKDELKLGLNIAYASAELGTVFDGSGLALCPFHDDHDNPNLELIAPGEDGFPWAFCRACGWAGDVIKFIKDRNDVSFPTALVIGSEMYERQPARFEQAIPRKRTIYKVTPEWEEKLAEYQAHAREHAELGLLSFSYGFTTEDTPQGTRQRWDEWLLSWGWGLDPLCQVVIPHRNADGTLECVKVRLRDGDWRAYGELKSLYGSWRTNNSMNAILLEGESDCVWSAKQAPDADVLGLPAGASSFKEEWVRQLLMYDTIYIGIDNDAAGNRAVPKWEQALSTRDVRRFILPWERDVRETGKPIAELMEHAESRGSEAQLEEELDMVVTDA